MIEIRGAELFSKIKHLKISALNLQKILKSQHQTKPGVLTTLIHPTPASLHALDLLFLPKKLE